MLRVAEQAFRSDTGRQRNANEDSFFARAPMFAVADGMGGAQAGEVASRIAAESFEPAERGGQAPEAYLREIAEAANDRIHRLAQSDATHSGMGTTLTAALLEPERDEISLAHVGDSRAYLWREGRLKLLTSDHSLVEELRRQGRLTEEEAEDHPQRSIITRALGPESDVEVDTMTYSARPGDVYLLCSDGLTTMVKDDGIAEILASAADLEDAASELVRAANDAGGRDNITVVAFRLEEAEVGAVPEEGATLIGPAAEEAGLTAGAVRAEAERERAALGGAAGAPPARRRRSRRALKVGLAILALGAIVTAAVLGARQIYFLGSDEGGRLALYRGLPYTLPFDVELYSEVYSTPTQVASVPASRRDSATDHTLRSHDDAVDLLRSLEAAALPPQPLRTPRERSGRAQQGSGSKPAGEQRKSGGGGSAGGSAGGRRDRNRRGSG